MECLGSVDSSASLVVIAWVALILLVFILIRSRKVLARLRDSGLQHRLLASILFLSLLWHIRYEMDFGVAFHFLGITFVTLMLRGNLAVLAGIVALLVLALTGQTSWALLPFNAILAVLLPVTLTIVAVYLERKAEFRTFFGYIFICGFFGAGVAIASSLLSGMLFCWGIGSATWSADQSTFLSYLPLIMLPEGVINGMLVTGILVYFPGWLETFDPDRYR